MKIDHFKQSITDTEARECVLEAFREHNLRLSQETQTLQRKKSLFRFFQPSGTTPTTQGTSQANVQTPHPPRRTHHKR